jgi:hypothetical protein
MLGTAYSQSSTATAARFYRTRGTLRSSRFDMILCDLSIRKSQQQHDYEASHLNPRAYASLFLKDQIRLRSRRTGTSTGTTSKICDGGY